MSEPAAGDFTVKADPVFMPAGFRVGRVAMPDSGKKQESMTGLQWRRRNWVLIQMFRGRWKYKGAQTLRECARAASRNAKPLGWPLGGYFVCGATRISPAVVA